MLPPFLKTFPLKICINLNSLIVGKQGKISTLLSEGIGVCIWRFLRLMAR